MLLTATPAPNSQHPCRRKTCVVITGPTASGKTAMAIALAQHFKTEIISADSRQCFRELNIAVAKPTPEQLQLVKHHFIDSHSIKEEVNAGVFERYALSAIAKIFQEHDTAVMVGGTGLYIKAFCEGMDEVPAAKPAIREYIGNQYKEKGIDWLQAELAVHDAGWLSSGDGQNPQRMMRALEVVMETGRSIRSYQQSFRKTRPFQIIKIGLNLPRQQLYNQINARTDEMINGGLEEEVRSLLPFRELNALQTVGYREMFEYFDGNINLQQAVDLIKQHTRQYAKRQLTWFMKDPEINWFSPLDFNQLIKYLHNLV